MINTIWLARKSLKALAMLALPTLAFGAWYDDPTVKATTQLAKHVFGCKVVLTIS